MAVVKIHFITYLISLFTPDHRTDMWFPPNYKKDTIVKDVLCAVALQCGPGLFTQHYCLQNVLIKAISEEWMYYNRANICNGQVFANFWPYSASLLVIH